MRIFSDKTISVLKRDGVITVVFPDPIKSQTVISLFSAGGRKIRQVTCGSGSTAEITTRSLGAGVYYITASSDGAVVKRKFLITP
jgi:hypothetical protein